MCTANREDGARVAGGILYSVHASNRLLSRNGIWVALAKNKSSPWMGAKIFTSSQCQGKTITGNHNERGLQSRDHKIMQKKDLMCRAIRIPHSYQGAREAKSVIPTEC